MNAMANKNVMSFNFMNFNENIVNMNEKVEN